MKKLFIILVLIVSNWSTAQDEAQRRQTAEYQRLSQATQRAYAVPTSTYTTPTYRSSVSSGSQSSSSSYNSRSSNSATTYSNSGNDNSWADYSHINRQNKAGAYNDALITAFEGKQALMEALIKERKLEKIKENYQDIYNCALDAGFDSYTAGRLLGFSADEYQAMLVRQGLAQAPNSSGYNNNSSNDPNVNGNFTGYGTKNYSNGATYVGDLVLGIQEGKGKITYPDGTTYEGQIRQNNFEGFGVIRWSNGDVYSGNHRNNKRNGFGKLVFVNGDSYEGNFVDNIESGRGKYTWKDGTIYDGYFENDKPTGAGKYTYINSDGSVSNYSLPKIVGFGDKLIDDSNNIINYFAESAKNANIVSTDSGLKYIILKEGSGAMPKINNTVRVSYQGMLTNGTVFDSSKDYIDGFDFSVDSVIPGWTEALQLMNVGSQFQLYMPSHLAFGEKGLKNKVQPNETIIYTITLLEVK